MSSSQSFRDHVSSICAPLPGSEKSDPWGGGHDAWKIGGKMFACIGATLPGIAVKCTDIETAEMLIEAGIGNKAPYFHKSWVQLDEGVDGEELEHRLVTSYDLVRSKLTKKFQNSLLEREKT